MGSPSLKQMCSWSSAICLHCALPAPPRLRKSKYKAGSFWTPSLEWKKSGITERHVQYRFPVNLPAVTVKVEVVSADIYFVWLLSSVSQHSFTGLCTQTQFGSCDASLVSYFLYLCHEPFLILHRFKPCSHQFSQFTFSILYFKKKKKSFFITSTAHISGQLVDLDVI